MDCSCILLSLLKELLVIFSAFLTVKWTLKTYIYKKVFNKQKDLYIIFLNYLLKIERNPYLQFSSKTVAALEDVQAEFKMYASKKCNKDFSSILERIRKLHNNYVADKDPNEDEIIDSDIVSAINLQESDERYKDKHRILDVELQNTIDKAVKHIRKSLRIR